MQSQTDQERFIERIKRTKSLATLPSVVREVLVLADDENISTAQVATLISKDPVITARVLRLVNSPFYGFPNRISTITQALVLLGLTVMKGILLGIAVADSMEKRMEGLWPHSVGCSLGAGMLGNRIGELDPEEFQVAGLLHDLGKLVIAQDFPDELAEIRRLVQAEDLSFLEAERRVFDGASHLDINAILAERWSFPPRLRDAMTHYPDPPRAEYDSRGAAVVQLAHVLTRGAGFGFAGDDRVPAISAVTVHELGLDEDSLREFVAEFTEALDRLDVGAFTA